MTTGKCYWFVFFKDNILLKKKNGKGGFEIPFAERPPVEMPEMACLHTITPMGGDVPCKAFSIGFEYPEDNSYKMWNLRSSWDVLPEPFYLKAGKAREILYWDEHNHYCGVCGGEMKMNTEISKKCARCGNTVWPQLATAIIVLIHRDNKILMVHAKNFKGNFYGLVAGFVETGETLEHAVRREVMEETNLTIKNLKYYASQPWPYPCGLMVGFTAEYDAGELKLQESELSGGMWVSKDNLPEIPRELSLARKLIDLWLDGKVN